MKTDCGADLLGFLKVHPTCSVDFLKAETCGVHQGGDMTHSHLEFFVLRGIGTSAGEIQLRSEEGWRQIGYTWVCCWSLGHSWVS